MVATKRTPKKARGAEAWRSIVEKYAPKYGLPVDAVLRVIRQESGGNPRIVSKAGAIGLMQLMPGTARDLKVDPRDPEQNIQGGIRYLASKVQRLGSWEKGLAAYNAGEGRVKKAVARAAARGGRWTDYLPQETQNYVRILGSGPQPERMASAGRLMEEPGKHLAPNIPAPPPATAAGGQTGFDQLQAFQQRIREIQSRDIWTPAGTPGGQDIQEYLARIQQIGQRDIWNQGG